jgi:hypothetical protein
MPFKKRREPMPTKPSLPGLIMLLGCILLFACDSPLGPAAPDPPMGVTPRDTSAPTLMVKMVINEDQDAVDGMSNILLWFRTNIIEEDNYVIFDDEEYVTCDGTILKLHNMPVYNTLKVPQKRYICHYIGDTQGIGQLPPVLMADVPARSRLSPRQLFVDGQGYKIRYTADPPDPACNIKAVAKDNAGKSVDGPSSSPSLGVYVGPPTTTLNGPGEILLIRTCHWKPDVPFFRFDLTYQSEASVEVTWSH